MSEKTDSAMQLYQVDNLDPDSTIPIDGLSDPGDENFIPVESLGKGEEGCTVYAVPKEFGDSLYGNGKKVRELGTLIGQYRYGGEFLDWLTR